MARALLTVRGDLDERLGTGAAGVAAELLRLARRWAGAVAPSPPARVVPLDEVETAARAAFADAGAPLLVASAETPRLGVAHARMALDDLAAGADVSIGPGMEGGWYLVALARPHELLFELVGAGAEAAEVMTRVLGLARTGGLDVGLLRMERMLRTPRDVAAVRIDPLTPEPVRTALGRMG